MKPKLLMGAAMVLALGACEVETKTPAAAAAEQVAVKAGADGRVSFDLPFAKGEVKLPAGLMQDAKINLGGVELMPGATVTGFNLDQAGEAAKVVLTYEAPLSPAEAKAYFAEQFAAKNIAIAPLADAITGKTPDGASFAMRFAPGGGGTAGTIEINPAR